MSHRKFDMKPSCTRLRQSAKRLLSAGGEAIEYARVSSSPSGLVCFNESHWPGTKPKRGPSSISNSRCLVGSEKWDGTHQPRRVSLEYWHISLDEVERYGEAGR